MIRESQIKHETPNGFWVIQLKKNIFQIQLNNPDPMNAVNGSKTIEAYSDLSLAIARCDYLEKTHLDLNKRVQFFNRH